LLPFAHVVLPTKGPRPNHTAPRYIETSGIQWCSGGGDYSPGDVFGAGVNGKAPQIPRNWTDVKAVKRCEQVHQ